MALNLVYGRLGGVSLVQDTTLAAAWRQLFFNNFTQESFRDLGSSAAVTAGNTRSLTTTAVAGFGGQKDLLTGAVLARSVHRDLSTTAATTAPAVRSLTSDAAVQARRSRDLAPKAALSTTNTTALTASAAVSALRHQDLSSSLVVQPAFTQNLETDAAVQADERRDLPTSAAVVRLGAASLPTSAAVVQRPHADLATDAALRTTRRQDLGSGAAVYVVQIPVITGVSYVPETVTPVAVRTAGGDRVSLLGRLFTTATDVLVDGVSVGPAAFTVFSDTLIGLTVPPHGAGTVHVRVVTPDGVSGLVVADEIRYTTFPTLTSVSPNNGPPEGTTGIVLAGSGFLAPNLVLRFNSDHNVLLDPTTYTIDSDVQITVHTLSGASTSEGVAAQVGRFQVIGDDGYTAFGTAPTFTWWPSVRGVVPNTGGPHGGGVVDVTGIWFAAAATVSFGGVPSAHVTFLSTSHLQAVVPPGAGGVVDVQVTTTRGTSLAQALDRFTYQVVSSQIDLSSSAVIGSYPPPRPQAVQVFLRTGIRTGLRFVVPDTSTAKLSDLLQ